MTGTETRPSHEAKGGVPLRPDTLAWALRRAGLTEEALARRVSVKAEKVEAWLYGKERPTYAQARKIAHALHLGLTSLLLPPPEVRLPIKDFRRGSVRREEPSPELLEAVYDAFRKRDWWRERRKRPLDFVGSGRQKEPIEVAKSINELIPIEELVRRTRTPQDLLKLLTQAAEERGLLVLRQGHVGSNTRRVYDPKEFSGFTVVDSMAPVIFINTRDYLPRQIFTFAHELAHIWRGEGGLEGGLENVEIEPDAAVEVWADEVAANLLMPEAFFRSTWKENIAPLEAAKEASTRFKVSKEAALRRALTLGIITRADFFESLDRLKEQGFPEPSSDGGNFWRTFEAQNSPTFISELRRAALQGEVDAKEVAILLNINLRTAWKFLTKGDE